MKRFRIDFSIREADVPPEDAQGIRFGDEVDAPSIFEFFNKCRDAAMALFNSVRPKVDPEVEKLRTALEAKDRELRLLQKDFDLLYKTVNKPIGRGDPGRFSRDMLPRDGSRGGDGPPGLPDW